MTCLPYDRRESGSSGGRVQRLSWDVYADEARGLLDSLQIERAVIMGACMGCAVAVAFAARYPEMTQALVLHWLVGGARYHEMGQDRFARHLAHVQEHGLDGVVALARQAKTFGQEPRVGPWGSELAREASFASAFRSQDLERYIALIRVTNRTMYDRDTAPGAEPEELRVMKIPALIIPGNDPAHTTSAAQYLAECLPQAEYWDEAVPKQSGNKVRECIRNLLRAHVPEKG